MLVELMGASQLNTAVWVSAGSRLTSFRNPKGFIVILTASSMRGQCVAAMGERVCCNP